MRVLNDCCSCAPAEAARARPATRTAANVLTSSSSICPRAPTLILPRMRGRVEKRRAPSTKEAAHELGRLVLADAAIDFRPMQAGRVGKIPHTVFDRSTLWIGRSEIEAADACERDRCRAHGARLQRHVEIAIEEPFVAELSRSLSDRQHLGMRSGVMVRDGAVRRLRDR